LEFTCSFAKDTTQTEFDVVAVWVLVVVTVDVRMFDEPAKYPPTALTAIKMTTTVAMTLFLMPKVAGSTGFTPTDKNGLAILVGVGVGRTRC
jgi:hypothetical protein